MKCRDRRIVWKSNERGWVALSSNGSHWSEPFETPHEAKVSEGNPGWLKGGHSHRRAWGFDRIRKKWFRLSKIGVEDYLSDRYDFERLPFDEFLDREDHGI